MVQPCCPLSMLKLLTFKEVVEKDLWLLGASSLHQPFHPPLPPQDPDWLRNSVDLTHQGTALKALLVAPPLPHPPSVPSLFRVNFLPLGLPPFLPHTIPQSQPSLIWISPVVCLSHFVPGSDAHSGNRFGSCWQCPSAGCEEAI